MSATVSSTSVLKLGYKVQSDWAANAALFAGYKTSKADYDSALERAAAAKAAATTKREQRSAELARVKAQKQEAIARLNSEYELLRQNLNTEVATAAAAEQAAMQEVSRLANGARYYAKYTALSDLDTANDAAAKAI